uniref:Cadherin domain-containing protein n=1 Tax=Schistocephalus solidus TaxID=70667 RepID=A0A0X3NRY7_SCHSO
MVCTNKNAAKENPPPKSRPEFMLKWRANMLRLMLIIVCMPLYPFSSYYQASGTSTMTDLAVFAPIALYSIVEETPGPQTLGDLIPILLSTEFASANGANASQLSSIVFFPSTQPFSEYFQLHRRTRTEHGREFLTTCFLELQKSIDLEEVCKIRLYGEDCAKTAQTVNIAMRGRTCCCDTSLLFCSLQLQLAMLGSHSTLPILDRFSQLQRQESFPVFLVEVRIFDANENSPTYSQAEYSLRVTEGPESTTIFQLPTARDADMGENGRITYFLTDIFVKLTTGNDWQRCPSCASLFHVIQKPAIKDSSSGRDLLYLQVNAELDREKENAYRLLVLAKDAGRPIQKTGTLYVSIEVLDSNDMKPEFSHLAYNFLIDENVPRGTFVGRVEAKDKDIGMNARVSYSLRPKHRGPPDNLFYSSANMNTPFIIHAATGVLTVNGSLDRERQTEYTVYVEATDHGSPAKSSESIVHITVLDLNDNSPNVQIRMLDTIERVREINTANTNTKEIREFEITLPENLPVDVILAEIDAFDPDVGANGSVFCVLLSDVFLLRPLQAESVTIFGAAEINSTLQSNHIIKYRLHLSKPIDFEQQKFFRLVLTCYDSGTPFQRSTRSIINVFIRDENDNPPVLGDAEVITPAWKVEKWVLNSWKGEQTELIEAMKMILTENLLLLCLPKWLATKQPFLRIPATDRDAENNAKLAYHLSFF